MPRALRLNPQLSYAHHVYGVALHSQGKLAEAIQAYRKAIAFQANLVDAHYLLGRAWQESGDIPLALGAFKKTLGLNPFTWTQWVILPGSILIWAEIEVKPPSGSIEP